MKLEHYPVEKLKKEVLAIVGRHADLGKFRIFFFGSRVDGTGGERSDIDIGIEGPDPLPFETVLRIKADLKEIPVLYKIDVVDFRNVSKDFRDVAMKRVESIT